MHTKTTWICGEKGYWTGPKRQRGRNSEPRIARCNRTSEGPADRVKGGAARLKTKAERPCEGEESRGNRIYGAAENGEQMDLSFVGHWDAAAMDQGSITWTLDLSAADETGEPWNFNRVAARSKAVSLMCDEKPALVIGSSTSTAWAMGEREQAKERARVRQRFLCQLYRLQHREGRHYMHEGPWGAMSGECAQQIHEATAALALTVHQSDKTGTSFLTNGATVATALGRERKNHCEPFKRGERIGRVSGARTSTIPPMLHQATEDGLFIQKAWDRGGESFIGIIQGGGKKE